MLKISCRQCGIEMAIYASRLGRKKFCSTKCRDANHRFASDNKKCELCGAEFSRGRIPPAQWAKAKYCSTTCRVVGSRDPAALSKLPEFRVWTGMLDRCHCSTNTRFKDYGGRGIFVCERWRTFANFIADMGSRPSGDLTVERIDNDQGYHPGNVKWATRQEQNLNKRTTRLVTAFGATKPLVTWARERGINYGTLHSRLTVLGWDAEQALTLPADPISRALR